MSLLPRVARKSASLCVRLFLLPAVGVEPAHTLNNPQGTSVCATGNIFNTELPQNDTVESKARVYTAIRPISDSSDFGFFSGLCFDSFDAIYAADVGSSRTLIPQEIRRDRVPQYSSARFG